MKKEIKYRFNEGQMCTHCIRRDCICEERQSDGSWIAKPKQNNWKEKLICEVMDDYILKAEMKHYHKDEKVYYEDMRRHLSKLETFIETLLSSQAHALKEQMKNCVPKKKNKKGNLATEEIYNESGFNDCREQTLSAIESIKI